jgi:hypothetical protein
LGLISADHWIGISRAAARDNLDRYSWLIYAKTAAAAAIFRLKIGAIHVVVTRIDDRRAD